MKDAALTHHGVPTQCSRVISCVGCPATRFCCAEWTAKQVWSCSPPLCAHVQSANKLLCKQAELDCI